MRKFQAWWRRVMLVTSLPVSFEEYLESTSALMNIADNLHELLLAHTAYLDRLSKEDGIDHRLSFSTFFLQNEETFRQQVAERHTHQ